jgi:glucose-6-phosphate-specific signal transduction histidine kinase
MAAAKVEKLTVEIRKSAADRLRRLRLRLRETDELPVTQQMIVEHLINEASHEALRSYFGKLPTRLGLDETEVRARRRAAYTKQKQKKRKSGR